MISPRQAYLRLGLILTIFFILSLAHNIWVPLHDPPDEIAHFQYSQFIARNGRLPLNAAERQAAGYLSFWPPLYHMLAAVTTGWSDSMDPPRLKLVWESPRFELVSELLDTKRLANTEDELLPFRGAVLMWHLGRIISTCLSLVTIVVAFFTALELCPGNYRLSIFAAAVTAFVPAFIYISAALSYEPLVGLLTGVYFWLLVRLVKGQSQPIIYIGLGVCMGLAVTAKYSAVILPVQVVGILIFLAWQQGWSWPSWFKRVSLTGLAAVLASGWWFLFLIVNFNEIAQFGLITGSLKPIIAGGIDASQNYTAYLLTGGQIGSIESREIVTDSFWHWAERIYQSFWVMNIGDYPLGLAAQVLMGVACAIAGISLFKMWQRRPESRIWIALLISQPLIFIVFPLLRFVIQGQVSWTAQGRHVLFPVATVLPLLMGYGWQAWFTPKTQRWLALILVGGLACWSMAQLVRVATFYPPLLPIRTTPEAVAQIPHRLNQPFGDHLLLQGYDLQLDSTNSALKLSLYWQSPSYPDEDYKMSVRLVQHEETRLNWEAYPLNGRYPTRAWESWELIRDDLVLPLFDLPAGAYQVQVQLQGAEGPLLIDNQDYFTVAEIELPEVSPLKPEIHLPAVVERRQVVSGLSLWQADMYRGLWLPKYRPRMAISFVWQGQPLAGERVQWLLVDPAGGAHLSQSASPQFEYFVVSPDWSSGDYRLRVEVWRDNQVVASQETGPIVTVFNEKPRRLQPPPITHPLAANFANQVKLLGYDLLDRSLSPGQGVPLTLYWQGLRTMGQSYTVFTKLLDQNQQAWGQAERLPADGYKTTFWLENETVVDGFELPVKPDIPDGIYWLNVGLYQEVNGAAVSLPLVLNDQTSEVTSVTFGPVKIGGPPPGTVVPTVGAGSTRPASLVWGEPSIIQLEGYKLTQTGQILTLTLYWKSLAQTSLNWTTFVHLRNQAGQTIAQKDGPTGHGVYPTSLWDVGEIIADEVTLTIGNLPKDSYTIAIGLYDLATGQRLAVPGHADNEVLLRKGP